MIARHQWIAVALLAVAWTAGPVAATGADEVVDPFVQAAAASAPARPPAPASSLAFLAAPAQVGDRVVQRLGFRLQASTRVVQSGQVAHEGTHLMVRQQQRTIDVLSVDGGRAGKVRASFEISRRQSPEDGAPDELVKLPIEGRTYLMSRVGDEVQVADDRGAIPPLEEYKLVAAALAGVGLPNPLAELLAGKSLHVGEQMLVPRELAQTLLGFGATEFARVHRFELTLARAAASEAGDQPLAVFGARIDVRPEDEEDLTMHLTGELVVDPATCRLTSLDLAGPVHVTRIERTPLGIYQDSMAGEVQMALRAHYSRPTK